MSSNEEIYIPQTAEEIGNPGVVKQSETNVTLQLCLPSLFKILSEKKVVSN